jgi:uncharacterized phosphatase
MNDLGVYSGATDTPLTDDGRAQAKKAGQAAKDLNIDLIVSSPLSRALETAQIVAREISYPVEEIITHNDLVERHFGKLEGEPWPLGKPFDADLGVETDEALLIRAQRVLDWINRVPGDHVLIVAHGAIGRAIRSILKTEFPMSHPEYLPNAEIVCWVEETD